MPGRIAGETIDCTGKRCFVLTLQPREQHIRREKATSNICTNQALLALRACIYLCALGKAGIAEVSNLNIQKSHYTYDRLCALDIFKPAFEKPFFNEFSLRGEGDLSAGKINECLLKNGIIGGLELSSFYPELENTMLLCVTETKARESIDRLVAETSPDSIGAAIKMNQTEPFIFQISSPGKALFYPSRLRCTRETGNASPAAKYVEGKRGEVAGGF